MISRRGLLMTASYSVLAMGLAPAIAWAEAKRGGDVIVGIRSAIPSLDIMATTDDIGRIINLHLYEALVTRDEGLQPSAGLAESWTVSDDGLLYTFELRQGVKFHNGKEMTSADVKASIDRFIRMALRKNYLANVTEVRATGPYTVEVQLAEPQPLFLDNFSQPEVLVAILPEEDGSAEPSATSLIGTGPYKLAESVADSHIRLDRFDDYALDTRYTGTDGYGGRKEALFDTITFRIIPEPSAMVAALEAGEIHLADLVPETAVPRLQADPEIEVFVKMPTAMNSISLNLALPPMDNLDFRKAIMAALDFDELLDAAADGNYQLNPYMQYPGYPTYPGAVTAPLYNAKDLDLARELVAKSGYDGRPIVIMSATTYTWSSNTALVVSERLKEIGVNVEIDVMDWPAVVSRRSSPEGWHLNPGQFGTGPWLGDPVLSIGALGTPNSANHKQDPYLVGLLTDMQLKPTADERMAAWLEAQQYILDEVLTLKLGDVGLTQAASREITGFVPFRTTRMWNVGFV